MKKNHAGHLALLAAFAVPATGLADEATSPVTLDSMVVTGTRQQENLLDLAGNTSIIDQPRIEFTAPQKPAELLNQAPGVNIQQGSGEEHLTAIRSPALNSGSGAGSFLYLEDGVPLRAAGFANINGLFEENVEQAGSVEIVRGPGSALYGSNAEHGLINVIPRAPSKTDEAELDLTSGPNARERLMGTISGTNDNNNGLRFSAEENHDGGWRFHTSLDEQKFIARDVWKGADDTVTSTVSGQNLDQNTGGYVTGKDNYKNFGLAKSNSDPEAYRRADSIRAMSRWQHDLSDSLQLTLTPYVRNTDMQFIQHYLPSKALEQNGHSSGGLQSAVYKSLEGGHSIIFGTDFEYTDGGLTETQSIANQPGGYLKGVHYDYNVAAVVIAPYIHSEWQVLERTRITAGMRLENTNYDYNNNTATGAFGRFLRVADRADNFTTLTPKLGVVQKWTDQVASYVNLSRGSRAPQTSELYELQTHQAPGQVKPETLDSLEVGTRGTIEDVRFDASAFWMYKNHFFYRDADGYNVTNGVTEHRGVELEVSSPLPANFDIGASGSYALHTYEFNRPVSSTINPTDAVTKGDSVSEAPRVLANMRLGYTFAPGIRGEIEWVHVGPYFMDASNLHSYSGHELMNIRLAAKLNDYLTLHGKILNATNVAYADRAAFANNTYQYFPGLPLTVFGGVTAKF